MHGIVQKGCADLGERGGGDFGRLGGGRTAKVKGPGGGAVVLDIGRRGGGGHGGYFIAREGVA